MFKVKNTFIQEEPMEVIRKLKEHLAEIGIERFSIIKESHNNIMFNCPIHKEGQEKSPSCGISTVDKGAISAGTVHCFTCDYTATLDEMISHLFGKTDSGSFGRKWLMNNFISNSLDNRKSLNIEIFDRNIKKEKEKFMTEKELSKFDFIHSYMYKRKLTDEMIELYNVGYDKIQKCITFPVRNMEGKTYYVCRRSIKFKFFNYPEGAEKHLYGIYELPINCDEVIITESCINAITSTMYGRPAIALLGRVLTDLQKQELLQLDVRTIVLALDGDEAGRKGTLKIGKSLKKHFIVKFLEIPDGKDINDLTEQEFKNLEEYFL